MGPNDYSTSRANLRREVGDRVKKYKLEQGRRVGEIAEAIHEGLALSESSARGFISAVMKGRHPAYSTNTGCGVPFTQLESLRLSKLLENIGVSPDDSLIESLRQQVPHFEYPYHGEIPVSVHSKMRRGEGRALNYEI